MDEELLALLLEEVERRRVSLERDSSPPSARSVAHALKGSLGLAGVREASEAFARIERRLAAQDPRAISDLQAALIHLVNALRSGQPLPESTWPRPPEDLRATGVSALPADYVSTVHDRLARIDAELAGPRDMEATRAVYREVHTIKGAALSIGDDIMAWFCHGLEERLRTASTPAAGRKALEHVDTYRGVLAEIVAAPGHALETLHLMAGSAPPPRPGPTPLPIPLPPRRPADLPSESESRALAESDTVRVSTNTLDRLFERASRLGQLRAPLSGGASNLTRAGGAARDIQRGVREALRMIGPPRPWGAPAAAISRLESAAEKLARVAELVDVSAAQMTALSRRLASEGDTFSATVQSLRTSSAASLLEGLAASARSEAERLDKSVHVVIAGGDKLVDRRLLEALVDPVRQLVRNAVAHGLETPDVREAAGKPRIGTLRLSVQQGAGTLTLTVEDDGAGVDVSFVKSRAVERGLLSAGEASEIDDRTALSLLFYPGFSLRADADLLAGRGVGLDLTQAAAQRLGGTVHLDNTTGHGLVATLTVPAEATLVRVVWLRCAGDSFGLPVQYVRRVARLADWDRPIASLARLLRDAVDNTRVGSDQLAVEIAPALGAPTVAVAIEGLGSIDEVALRALPGLVRALGPFGAGVVWADDLRLCLDPLQLARDAAREERTKEPAAG